MISSPLNYTGRKFKLLPQILPLFPSKIDTFVDLFCGGCDVGINVNCNSVLFNDIDTNLIGVLSAFSALEKKEVFEIINDIIKKYNLSDVKKYGYEYYNCDSGKGLGPYNKEGYLHLRKDFNNTDIIDYQYFITLYVLIIYSFNNQIRFNKDGNFNLPVGKRDFNVRMKNKLDNFIDKLKATSHHFSSLDFRDTSIELLDENDFIYADPPYLITCASYNEQGKWDENIEKDLYSFLDEINEKGIRFALSNVLFSKGKTNSILKEWLDGHPQYKCHFLKYDYSNCNYHKQDRTSGSGEILITNY